MNDLARRLFDYMVTGRDPMAAEHPAAIAVEESPARLSSVARDLPVEPVPEFRSPATGWDKALSLGSLPARLATAMAKDAVESAWSGFTYPGDVYLGKAPPDDIGRVLDTAGLFTLGGFGGARGLEAAGNLASKTARMYDPPVKSARAFELDYPAGAVADDAGKLAFDIEGRPLTARFIAGRNVVGASEKAITPAELDAIAAASTRDGASSVAPRLLRGDAGRTQFDKITGDPLSILIAKDLSEDQAGKVLSHEIGHVVDRASGEIPVNGLGSELRSVYNDLNNPQSYGKAFGPEQNRYKGPDVDRELMAEAIRAYMTDPNYIKTVAPKTAARIRAHVNANPKLQDTIQFNAGGVPAGLFDVNAPGPMTDEEFGALYRAGFAA